MFFYMLNLFFSIIFSSDEEDQVLHMKVPAVAISQPSPEISYEDEQYDQVRTAYYSDVTNSSVNTFFRCVHDSLME